ncbi:MAG: flavodoxin FldA [Moorea sp. SIO3G5]|nr:flavodoxin FldA [Moorena sp. SIO3G5]
MSKIGLFVGSQTGKTEAAAEEIQAGLGGDDVVTIHKIEDTENSDFDKYENIIIGCPTWDIGELQADWDGYFEELDNINFSGKKIAYFGTGDQEGYPDNFMDAIGIIEAKISELGGTTVGQWPKTEEYEFNESKALKNGKFIGLALDDDNQSELTEQRIKTWVTQLKQEFGV